MSGIGGYDDGYLACPCFWGMEPGSLIRDLSALLSDLCEFRVLDLGCGEGKNAAFFAERGAIVTAVDISAAALVNGQRAWPNTNRIEWVCADVTTYQLPKSPSYDIVVAYGLLHCLHSASAISHMMRSMKNATVPGGWNVLCTFNDRCQQLQDAHPDFRPYLLDHGFFIERFSDWQIVSASDSDLVESHPNTCIRHVHSMTRIIARRPEE